MAERVLGLRRGEASVSPYRKEWEQEFERERTRLSNCLGSDLPIEHIGSTSVVGLSAKPILDLMVGVTDASFDALTRKLVDELGYLSRGTPLGPDNRIFIRIDASNIQTHKVHLVTFQGKEWAEKLFFRDELRKDPTLVDRYARLKQELAERFATDRPAYTRNKDAFVEKILEWRVNAGFLIRRARVEEAQELSALAMRSKAHWPYPKDYIEKCVDALRVEPTDIEQWPVFVAEAAGKVIGFCALKIIREEPRLDHLWILPEFIGKSIGRRLFAKSIEEAKKLGWTEFWLAADPYAIGFYEKQGAVQFGTVQSRIKPDLFLPHMKFDLRGE